MRQRSDLVEHRPQVLGDRPEISAAWIRSRASVCPRQVAIALSAASCCAQCGGDERLATGAERPGRRVLLAVRLD